MRTLRTSRFVRLTVLLSLTISLSACGPKTITVEPPYAPAINDGDWQRIYLTLRDGSELKVFKPTVRSDSVFGRQYNPRDRSYSDSVFVALSDVAVVERGKPMSTAAIVVVSVLGLVGLIGVAQLEPPPDFDN